MIGVRVSGDLCNDFSVHNDKFMMNSLPEAKHTIFLSGLYWQQTSAVMRIFKVVS